MTKLEVSINNIQVAVNVAEDKKVLEWFTQLDYADDHIWRLTSVTRFLLAPLHISALAEIPTVKGLKRALDALSTNLDETYDQAMQRIEEQGPWRKRLALRILTWLAFAEERLSPIELQHAVAIELPEDSPGGDLEPRENGLDEDSIPEMSVIDSICAGLITHDTENDVISLAHDTTNEYVRKRSAGWFSDGPMAYIAKACLTYLSFDAFSIGPCTTWDEFQERFFFQLASRIRSSALRGPCR